MNRLQFWLHARTRYSLHSPFLFDLYDRVLLARVEQGREAVPRRDRRYRDMVYKMSDFFAMRTVSTTPDTTALAGSQVVDRAIVVRCPHRSRQSEKEWETLCANANYNIAIDLFDVGLVLHNPHLLPQHFLLR